MNGTARVLIPATITEIGDGPYFYPACQRCYSKLIQSSGSYLCLKCGHNMSWDKMELRYRLSMVITDNSTYAMVTAFGAILNVFFGCSATEFGKRWSRMLLVLMGSMEQSVTKWAIEDSLVGCHMHFGFKIDSKLRKEKENETGRGISLRDIHGLGSGSFVSEQMNSNLVAVQVIAQNNTHLPNPVINNLQKVISLCKDRGVNGKMTELLWGQLQNLILEKRRQSKASSQTPVSFNPFEESCSVLSSLDQTSVAFNPLEDSCSVLSSLDQTSVAFNPLEDSCSLLSSLSLDQTSVAFNCDDSLRRLAFSCNTNSKTNNLSLSRKSQLTQPSPTNLIRKLDNITSENTFSNLLDPFTKSKRQDWSLSTLTLSQQKDSTEEYFTKTSEDEEEDGQNSVLLFENSVFCLNGDDSNDDEREREGKTQEIPREERGELNKSCLSPGLLLEKTLPSVIADDETTHISSDLSVLNSNIWSNEGESFNRISPSQCDQAFVGSPYNNSHNARDGFPSPHHTNSQHFLATDDEFRDSSVYHKITSGMHKRKILLSLKPNTNERTGNQLPFQLEYKETSSQNGKIAGSLWNDCKSACNPFYENGNPSLLDMPESEDLDLFLAATDNPPEKYRSTHGSSRQVSYARMHRTQSGPISQQYASSESDCAPQDQMNESRDLFSSQDSVCDTDPLPSFTKLSNFENLDKDIVPLREKSSPPNSEKNFHSINSHDRFSDSQFFHDKDFTSHDKSYDLFSTPASKSSSLPVSYARMPHTQNDLVLQQSKNFYASIEPVQVSQGQMDDSRDLFSSQDSSCDNDPLPSFKKISIFENLDKDFVPLRKIKSPSISGKNFHCINSHHSFSDSQFNYDKDFTSHNKSYDLFSTPASKYSKDENVGQIKDNPLKLALDYNSFELFSSDEEM